MRVNSSPSSLIGLVASYHVSAQLPLREHPQKPRADVPTRALQEKVLLPEPLGMGGAPRGPGSPYGMAAVARLLPRVLSPGTGARWPSQVHAPFHFPAEGPAFLQLILHEKVLFSSTNMLYFYYCSSNRLEKAGGHSGEQWQQTLWLGCWAGSVVQVPPLPCNPGRQQGGK